MTDEDVTVKQVLDSQAHHVLNWRQTATPPEVQELRTTAAASTAGREAGTASALRTESRRLVVSLCWFCPHPRPGKHVERMPKPELCPACIAQLDGLRAWLRRRPLTLTQAKVSDELTT